MWCSPSAASITSGRCAARRPAGHDAGAGEQLHPFPGGGGLGQGGVEGGALRGVAGPGAHLAVHQHHLRPGGAHPCQPLVQAQAEVLHILPAQRRIHPKLPDDESGPRQQHITLQPLEHLDHILAANAAVQHLYLYTRPMGGEFHLQPVRIGAFGRGGAGAGGGGGAEGHHPHRLAGRDAGGQRWQGQGRHLHPRAAGWARPGVAAATAAGQAKGSKSTAANSRRRIVAAL